MNMDFLFNDYDSYLEGHFESQYENFEGEAEQENIIHRLEMLGECPGIETSDEEIPF